jgi:hypothetical protein
MAAGPKSQSLKSSPKPIVLGTILAVLALFIGWLAYANLFAPPRDVPMSKEAQGKNDRLKQLAKQSGGDISKLSEEDRNWVTSVTGGYGAMVLQNLAKENK